VKAVGVDIGGTKISAGVVLGRELLSLTEQPLRRGSYEDLVGVVRELVLEAPLGAGDAAPARLGVVGAGALAAAREPGRPPLAEVPHV
jgi:predicted NBD/HSP70 family sugar kinase